MAPQSNKPVVLVPALQSHDGTAPLHVGRQEICRRGAAGRLPALIVPTAARDEIESLLDIAHGVLLTGNPVKVHPSHFDEGSTTRRCRRPRS